MKKKESPPAMMSKLNELRSHLERCKLLLEDISLEIHEIPKENAGYITDTQDLINTSINNTKKAIVSYMNSHSIEITPTIAIPADPINDYAAIESDEKPCEKASERRPIQYHPDPRMNKIVKASLEMGGLPLAKFIPKFVMEKPLMELCDIFAFINEIKELREKSKKYKETGVYAHLCEYGTIYVGISRVNHMGNGTLTIDESIRQRLHDHRNWHESGTLANWTGLYRVLSMIFYFPGDKEDENLIVLLLNNCLSNTKVRGGKYTGIGNINIPKINIEDIKLQLISRS